MRVGCIAGALRDYGYVAKLAKAGFDSIGIEPTRVYGIEDARQFLAGEGIDVDAVTKEVKGKFMSAFIRAGKPTSTKSWEEQPPQRICLNPTVCTGAG